MSRCNCGLMALRLCGRLSTTTATGPSISIVTVFSDIDLPQGRRAAATFAGASESTFVATAQPPRSHAGSADAVRRRADGREDYWAAAACAAGCMVQLWLACPWHGHAINGVWSSVDPSLTSMQ